MEDDFNLVKEVIQSLDEALADDERGELPKYLELRRGVLSEDGLDNLLRDVANVHSRMQALVEEPDPLDDGPTSFVEYDPLVDDPKSIPEESGSLVFVLRYMSNLHQLLGMELKGFDG